MTTKTPMSMTTDAEEYWPTIRRLVRDGWDLRGITGYCRYQAGISFIPSLQDIAAVVLRHRGELDEDLAFDGSLRRISAAADEARRNIIAICSEPVRLSVPSASSRAFTNLRARIMRRVAHMSAAA